MMARCVGCGKDWNVSICAEIPKTGYICPHCTSKLRAGEPLLKERKEPRHAKP